MAVSSPVPIFHEAVKCVFREWQALRIIVDNMFGGPMSKEKALWLEEVTADFVCNNAEVQKWELEDYISTIMEQEFNTQVDDASLPEISRKICHMYSLCINGKSAEVEEFIGKSKPAVTTEVECLSQESIGEDEASDVLEDIMEEEGGGQGMELHTDDDIDEQDISVRLDRVDISSEEVCPTLVSCSVKEKQQQLSTAAEEGEWEVVKKSRRKSKSKQT